MKNIIITMMALALSAYAQFTKIYDIVIQPNTLPANKPYLLGAYDIESSNTYNTYQLFLSNDKAVITNLETGIAETSIDLKNVVDTSYAITYIYFYKNFLASDGKWTGLIYEYDTNDRIYKMSLLSKGIKTATTIKSTGIPSVIQEGNKVYLYVTDPSLRSLYLVRNYTPAISAVSKQVQPFPSSLNAAENTFHFNIIGQQLSPMQYQDLTEALKRTTFTK